MKSSNVQKESVNCAHCAVRAKQKLQCVCTRVIFCSTRCKEAALATKSHVCPGAPRDSGEFERRRKEFENGTTGLGNAWREEFERTITAPMSAHPNGPNFRLPPLEEWIRCSELPGPCGLACAYQAACALKQRVLGRLEIDSHAIDLGGGDTGVLESNALSFKYFKQAAEGGLGLAMQVFPSSYQQISHALYPSYPLVFFLFVCILTDALMLAVAG